MAIPEWKSDGVESQLTALTGKYRPDTIRQNKCTTCDNPDMEFRSRAQQQEYCVSGMCRTCQVNVFGEATEQDEIRAEEY